MIETKLASLLLQSYILKSSVKWLLSILFFGGIVFESFYILLLANLHTVLSQFGKNRWSRRTSYFVVVFSYGNHLQIIRFVEKKKKSYTSKLIYMQKFDIKTFICIHEKVINCYKHNFTILNAFFNSWNFRRILLNLVLVLRWLSLLHNINSLWTFEIFNWYDFSVVI